MNMRIYCIGEHCQKHPEVAAYIDIEDETDSRLSMMGTYTCYACKRRRELENQGTPVKKNKEHTAYNQDPEEIKRVTEEALHTASVRVCRVRPKES